MSTSHAGSLSSSGSDFQIVGPATGKARRPYVLSWQQGTMSRCRLAERSRCRDATSMAVVTWSARYSGACPCRILKILLNVHGTVVKMNGGPVACCWCVSSEKLAAEEAAAKKAAEEKAARDLGLLPFYIYKSVFIVYLQVHSLLKCFPQ